LRICADENVAPKLSRLIRDQLLSPRHVLETVDDHQAGGVDDQIWVRKFAAAGGEAIVGGDFAMTKKPHEIVAIAETGLRLVVLDQAWPKAKKHWQMAYLCFWWPQIEAALESAKKGQCLKVPAAFDANRPIVPIKVDLQDAYAKVKKQAKK
jgi:hypothetical protein